MEDFYASIKLVTGEEILTQVLHDVDDDVIIIANAIEIEEMNVATSPGVFQCMITPHMWMKFSGEDSFCLLYTSPSPRDKRQSRMPSSA